MIKKISANKLSELKRSTLDHFPKYTTYLINQAAQTAQATRPNIVGQLSEEYPNYQKQCFERNIPQTVEGWKQYHKEKYPNALDDAVNKTSEMIKSFKDAIEKIDDVLIEEWVMDLLYEKTFYGFNLEGVIKLYFKELGIKVVDADSHDESKNIDLYLDDKPFQIKPSSFKHKQSIQSYIEIPIIYYEKVGNAIEIEFTDEYLEKKLG